MKIAIASGKGGTGKTSLTALFAVLGGKDILVADCDVDAADMHLLLEPDFSRNENSGKLVTKVKNEAKAAAEKEGKDFILVDGSPGVRCPVVSSLSGATFVVFVKNRQYPDSTI